MAFTPSELANIANATLDWYCTPDNLTPLERARRRLKLARRALKDAQAELAAALEHSAEVRRMPYAERHKRWSRSKEQGLFTLSAPGKPLLRELDELSLPKERDASGP